MVGDPEGEAVERMRRQVTGQYFHLAGTVRRNEISDCLFRERSGVDAQIVQQGVRLFLILMAADEKAVDGNTLVAPDSVPEFQRGISVGFVRGSLPVDVEIGSGFIPGEGDMLPDAVAQRSGGSDIGVFQVAGVAAEGVSPPPEPDRTRSPSRRRTVCGEECVPETVIRSFALFQLPLRLDPEGDGAALRQQVARERIAEQGPGLFRGTERLPGEPRNKFQISGFPRLFFSSGHCGFGGAVEGEVEEQFRFDGFPLLRRRKRGE